VMLMMDRKGRLVRLATIILFMRLAHSGAILVPSADLFHVLNVRY
jgi:hypothetical protein